MWTSHPTCTVEAQFYLLLSSALRACKCNFFLVKMTVEKGLGHQAKKSVAFQVENIIVLDR